MREYRRGHKSWIPSSCPRQPPEHQVRMGIAAMAQVAQAVLRRPGLRPSKSHPKRATHCGSAQSMVTADTMVATYATLRSHPDVTRRQSRMPRPIAAEARNLCSSQGVMLRGTLADLRGKRAGRRRC